MAACGGGVRRSLVTRAWFIKHVWWFQTCRPNLREVAVADVNLGHALQPGAPQLRRAGVGISQTVLKIHQHLRILLVLLHLCCGHQNSPDPFGQVLHLSREGSVLQKMRQQQQFFLGFNY